MLIYKDKTGIDEEMLKRINETADMAIREKRWENIDFDLLEEILKRRLNATVNNRYSKVEIVTPIKKEEMLKIVLDFFKSLDNEFYDKAISIILQKNKKIKLNIYNKHKIKQYGTRDEFNVREFTETGEVDTYRGRTNVNVPIKNQLKKSEESILEEGTGTLEDVFVLVHEITHLFDFDIQKTLPKKEEILGGNGIHKSSLTRELLCETTTFAFEELLTDYLIDKGEYSKEEIRQINNRRINSSIGDSRVVYMKLVLAKEKEKNGEIKIETIEKLSREYGIPHTKLKGMAIALTDDTDRIMFKNRYAIAGIIAPTIVKIYNEDKEKGIKVIKEYLKETKDDNLEGAFKVLGIEKNERGINTLIKNMKERENDGQIEK